MKLFIDRFSNLVKGTIHRRHLSFDTTSVSVQGDNALYPSENGNNEVMKIVHGHSKDHRPDLKQFMVKMLCIDRTIPVFGATEDGNAIDGFNKYFL